MNGTIKIEADDFASMTPEQKAYISTLGKAWREAADLRQVVAEQDRKIAEQAALLDRYDAAMKAHAFQLGKQDRELIQLRSRVKAAEAGDVATLRINNAFQHSEIMRLKAALAERETAALTEGTAAAIVAKCAAKIPVDQWTEADVAGWIATVNENASAFMEWYGAHAGSREAALAAKVSELEAALKAEKAENVKAHTECGTHYKATLRTRQRARLAEDMVAKLELALAERDAKIKALSADVERLKGIADHSNNLAQNRLEEAAKLRRELAVARDAMAKLEEATAAARNDAEAWKKAAQESVDEMRATNEQSQGDFEKIRLLEAKLAAAADAATWRAVSQVE